MSVSVATIIRDQIRAIDRMAMMAWGAKDLVDMGDGLKFKTSGMTPWKGYVYVRLDVANDLYNIDFFRIRKAEVIYDKQLEGVFVDQLVNEIDNYVG